MTPADSRGGVSAPSLPGRVIAIRPSAAARRRARREADALAGEIIEALTAFRASDGEAVHMANWMQARLMGIVFAHRLDAEVA